MRQYKYMRAAALLMACGMTVLTAGCSSSTQIGGKNVKVEKAEKVEKDTLEADSVVVSVGDETATYQELLVYMYILKTRYQDVFGDEVWSYKVDGERTMSSVAREQVISMITEMKVISRRAAELGIEISGDEREDIRKYAQTICDGADQTDVDAYMLDVEKVTDVYCENEIANRVYDACINGLATNISDEDAKQIIVQYIYLQTSGINQSGVEVVLSQEQVDKRRTEAKKLLKTAKTTDDFLSFAQANTEANEAQITFGRGDMSDEFTNAAMALTAGQLSGVVEAPEGFYIIYCVSDNEAELTIKKREELIAQAQKANFETQYKEWAAGYEVEVSPLVLS